SLRAALREHDPSVSQFEQDVLQEFGWDALSGTPDEIAAGLRVYADAGYRQVQVWLNQQTIEGIEAFAPVMAKVMG
ncbi:MAG TPA: hypothetical protein VE420_14770, partial [Gemmatimonadales bacterium]|nr:hypothetical protein [Gemmatimonadales bacterium]